MFFAALGRLSFEPTNAALGGLSFQPTNLGEPEVNMILALDGLFGFGLSTGWSFFRTSTNLGEPGDFLVVAPALGGLPFNKNCLKLLSDMLSRLMSMVDCCLVPIIWFLFKSVLYGLL